MVQYGFAIDQRTCIGCHACTVACKTEHQVPVGQFRTWVKYVDSGTFPDTTRDMGVMRCNHCTDAPCVQICPTSALFKREDGIVDFDNSRCIGCKACMQACPYDALYIDETTHTAAKCNFCTHRVDAGLEPACVVVCPTESIWVGDLHDPESAISQFVAGNETQVRTPEQGTGPNVHYVGASPAVLDPLAAPVDDTYLWAQPDALRLAVAPDLRAPVGRDDAAPRTTLNTAHPVAWGWRVPAYLWTKGVAGGALVAGAVGAVLGTDLAALGSWGLPLVALVALLATAVLLVVDLKRPERFWFLLDPRKGNWTSWLFKGGLTLAAASGLGFVWLVLGLFGVEGAALTTVAVLAGVAGVLVAGYTAWLFAQAEGRDLWQTPWLLPHLVVQALMAGSGVALLLAPFADLGDDAALLLAILLAVGVLGHVVIAMVELGSGHHTPNAAAAARMITQGRHRPAYLAGLALSVLGGVFGLLTIADIGPPWRALLAIAAGLVVQVGLLLHEHVYVRAAQEVPLS